MTRTQWILYDQCHPRYIARGVTDIVFFLYTGESISTPYGSMKLNIRSKIAEYAIAKAFLSDCAKLGYRTHFIETKSYHTGVSEYLEASGEKSLLLMTPSELYLRDKIRSWGLPIDSIANSQFLISEEEFQKAFPKPPVMEYFYRYMRKTRDILMERDGTPTGGRWNYDSENRKFDRDHIPTWDWQPSDTQFLSEAREYYHTPSLPCRFPTTRADALSLLEYFLDHHAHDFGRLEDAMYERDAFVHHSMLSIPLNFGLLHPSEVVEAVLGRDLPIESKEAFIRQVIGWREYMRQFYIHYRDDLYEQNALDHQEKIPAYWWDYSGEHHGERMTTMNCIDTVLARVQDENYSHHIERLMIIGNYALLMGYHPIKVNRWFAEMYIDAFEWVVSPNVLAMSQYSDGGRLATKPYISGGNYIEKMSDYCRGCRYSVKDKTCPMTALYWDFVDEKKSLFENGRNPYILSNLAKIDVEKIRAIKAAFLKTTQA